MKHKTMNTKFVPNMNMNSLNSFCLVLAGSENEFVYVLLYSSLEFKEPGEKELLSDWILLRG
jgi:hypothetical protein